MNLRREDFKRTARAPAKLNLILDLLGRRDDGFHELETLMVPLRLADTLTFNLLRHAESGKAAPIQLDVRMWDRLPRSATQTAIPSGPDNLVVHALELLRQRSGCELGARVVLDKRIPAAAGLGGGSSDAAAALRLANIGWQLDWSVERLTELAAEIGSDVPFFVRGGAAICRGRGELVEQLPAMPSVNVVIVKPPVDLSTGEVYHEYDAQSAKSTTRTASRDTIRHIFVGAALGSRLEIWRSMRNSLQNTASSLSPWVDRLRMVFDELGFLGHQLCGSGSAYFGVCRHAQHARRLANILRMRQLGLVYATRSCQ
ncbi:MAG TPA: 4-(cytidine 5'-diphospho)-2-C-methyl-D-erythritol kinase [Lacipirellulaceae bacterium]|jgi:4-diphosphocytidyl-2-C-methyl-D-erythritol kinase|nr:4-(cytidine 5'-diphospho)-2-C-methyl-D-erythritol kinase [Lacipirellulaceae bacterium]